MRRSRDAVAVAAIVLAAVAYTGLVIWRDTDSGTLRGSYDIYAAHYPSVIYALQSLRDGHGLLWNPFQNCGQPFLPSTLVGLLYPLHALFLVLDVETGFLVFAALHLTIGGIFTFLLCREYGLGHTGAVAGALAFMLGGSALALAVWLPTTILGPYVWMPAALYLTERVLRAPSVARGIGLGVCLTLGLLPGYPQILFFTYQLVVLRALWALATEPAARRLPVLGCLALGLVLPVFLGAAYLFPSMEFARESIRGQPLTAKEIEPLAVDTWTPFRQSAGLLTNSFLPIFTLVPMAVAAVALADRKHWRVTAFYLLCTALYMVLAFNRPLFELYRSLPMGSTFREPMRFMWIVSFTFSILVGLGADVITRPGAVSRPRGIVLAAMFVLGVGLFSLVCTRPFVGSEWLFLALGLLLVVSVALRRSPTVVVWVGLPLLLALNLLSQGSTPYMLRIVNTHDLFYRHADAFAFVRARMSAQDRMYHFGEHQDYSLTAKTASVFGVRTISDYEPQTSRRFAALIVQLFSQMRMTSINHYTFRLNAVPLDWRLFDLLAARYVVMDPRGMRFNFPLKPSLEPLWTDGDVRVLENPTALRRAYWVPQAKVIADPDRLLDRLLSPDHDPRRLTLVEEPPADGFLGAETDGAGEVVSMTDQAEILDLTVRAPRDGFLVLTDQYYPGWEATVNGGRVPILRANYAFRTVRVPAGESHVVFRYRPKSVRYGVWTSLASVVAIVTVLGAHLARGHRRS